MPWSGEHRAFVIERFIECGGSIIATQRAFRIHFGLGRHDPVPHHATIKVWVSNFRQTSSALKKKSPGRPRTATGPENVANVRAAIERSPRRSARKHSLALGISNRSIRRILHRDLKMHPYKMVVAQKLSERDFETRTNLCRDLRELPNDDVVLFTDEAHFHLCGAVNRQNFRYWSDENPREIHQEPLHSPKVTVWCALSRLGVWGPYFFEENGQTVTVNSERYCFMLENFLRPKMEENGVENVWFQQDGATAHTSRRSMDILRELFPGRLISLRGDVGWPPRSPDLTPCDFFLWGYLKSKVYQHRPRTLLALRREIARAIEEIPVEMTVKVMESYRERLNQCIRSQGRHLSDVLFKT